METRKSLIRRFLANLGWCYAFVAVHGFPWIGLFGSWLLAAVLLLPLLVWAWRDSDPGDPEILL